MILYQEFNDTYALVLGTFKNGAYRVLRYCPSRDRKAVKDSTNGWHPAPVHIDAADVPSEVMQKFADYERSR